jgi:NADPH-dependent 2,4-dienoyl-CoA reductase/sulfur reductase-like enzyme
MGVVLSPDLRLARLAREGAGVVAVLRNEYTGEEEERLVDAVVAEHGTVPEDALYLALKPHARNLGEIDLRALAKAAPQDVVRNREGRFRLFRVGDCVASRNIHAAIYDSLRLVKDF